tara:strand:- start:4823 stop:6547 length:1725 start_codon:yes stop_codon:yes gene_type:complete
MVKNENIFLGSGASLTLVPEIDLYLKIATTSSSTVLTLDTTYDWLLLVPDLYVGCTVDFYDDSAATPTVPTSTHIIKANSTNTITLAAGTGFEAVGGGTTATDYAAGDYITIRGYGAPCYGMERDSAGAISTTGTYASLNADNWLGIIETATFPNVEQELKQINLALGATRNVSHQYKGIRTASGGSVNLVMNTGAMLYYALGKCTSITCNLFGDPTTSRRTAAVDYSVINSGNVSAGSNLIAAATSAQRTFNDFTDEGPIFYKSQQGTTTLLPQLLPTDADSDMEHLAPSTTTATLVTNPIKYTFDECNNSDLPSFALEQTIVKDPSTASGYVTNADFSETATGADHESKNFTRIARGNRVNTLTLAANEGEEMKMTLDLNTRAVESVTKLYNQNSLDSKYVSRAGEEENFNLFNYNEGTEFMTPFFFSSGKFTIYGQEFLKMSSMTLTINNSLIDKRYMGGHRDIKEALAGQRLYELQFSAVVTDDMLFTQLLNEVENVGTSSAPSTTTAGLIEFEFEKDNGEYVKLHLKNYLIDTATWNIPDDKGPITIDATVKPRSLSLCEVNTHWVLQG